MRLGMPVGGRTVDEAIRGAKRFHEQGFRLLTMANIFGLDAITTCALIGREVPDVELATAVTPTYPRHPHAMAQQAMTAYDACDGRFILGIGLSHQIVIEMIMGLSFDKPAAHMREYLSVLLPLLDSGRVSHQGERYNVRGNLDRPREDRPLVAIAAMAPVMLKLAGAVADGTVLWMTGPKTIENHIAPSIRKAAADAGRPEPRIFAALPVCVTNDADAAKERGNREFATYGGLPSYRAMLDREGAPTPADVSIIGSEDQVVAGIKAIEESGCTDFTPTPFGSPEEVTRTIETVRALL